MQTSGTGNSPIIPRHSVEPSGWKNLYMNIQTTFKIALECGVHVFLAFINELCMSGLNDSRHITLREKAAILHYTCVTNLSFRHVGE